MIMGRLRSRLTLVCFALWKGCRPLGPRRTRSNRYHCASPQSTWWSRHHFYLFRLTSRSAWIVHFASDCMKLVWINVYFSFWKNAPSLYVSTFVHLGLLGLRGWAGSDTYLKRIYMTFQRQVVVVFFAWYNSLPKINSGLKERRLRLRSPSAIVSAERVAFFRQLLRFDRDSEAWLRSRGSKRASMLMIAAWETKEMCCPLNISTLILCQLRISSNLCLGIGGHYGWIRSAFASWETLHSN